ncbi:HPr kinase/phosphorylase [Philodulcilactobacillus myokoensis]|uniref:HPr kinase/phosphorylase n=1 Tax=Philodulcilactobacillus myokoensis TaxID=2929573 RepID=A0A9W6B1F9_9LACO|nr:HPr(Ser) kinase/phosphatase [Philodulcilactobacillus myokoensis]GLB47140.1 HPr kinase/phosphorylase [Philodulcilactobacillus myokoensis]
MTNHSVSVAELVKNTNLNVYYGKEYLDRLITTSDISRPGLELTGYFNYYPANRIQLLGITETSYAKGMANGQLFHVMEHMCQPETPAFVISTKLRPPKELIRAVKTEKIPVLGSELTTSRILSNMTNYLEGKLAERKSIHGVLVDIYGLGVLITGDSGIGKSETALELIKRGHRLIADDRVEVYQQDEHTLIGQAPQILRNLLEIRGIGIIDVMNLFGAGAVRGKTKVDLIIHLVNWSKDAPYDRLGNGNVYKKIFDVKVDQNTIPVKTGRNLAVLIESAAMNYRTRKMGYDVTATFNNNLQKLIQANSKDASYNTSKQKQILRNNKKAIQKNPHLKG